MMLNSIHCHISGWQVDICREPECTWEAAVYDPHDRQNRPHYIPPPVNAKDDADEIGCLITLASEYIRQVERNREGRDWYEFSEAGGLR